MHVYVTPCGRDVSVYLPQFSEENSYIKTIKILSSASGDNHTQRNSMADCSSLLCKTPGSSTCRNFLSRAIYEILTDRHSHILPHILRKNGFPFFSFCCVLVICFRFRFHAVSRKDPQQFIAADFSSSFLPV